MSARVREILGSYGAQSPGVVANLARILNHGRLGGSGIIGRNTFQRPRDEALRLLKDVMDIYAGK